MHQVTDLHHLLPLDEDIATVENCLCRVIVFTAIPHTKHAWNDSKEEKLPVNRNKLLTEPGSVQAAISHDQHDRTDTLKRDRKTDLGVCSMLIKRFKKIISQYLKVSQPNRTPD